MNFNSLIKSQIKNPHTIPIIIINFNQLFYLKKLVDFLLKRKFANIIIVDNLSTYTPLMEYYQTLQGVTIEYMDDNYGHMVFFENKPLQDKYGQGFYVVTDADIVPNENLPEDFMKQMIIHLIKNWEVITKVGFSLKIDDIPQTNKARDKVLAWEERFWKKKISKNIFEAGIDTTFAIYRPGYRPAGTHISFLQAHRFGGNFSANHGGWYIDQENLTDEQKYYQEKSNASASWLSNERGEILSTHYKKHY